MATPLLALGPQDRWAFVQSAISWFFLLNLGSYCETGWWLIIANHTSTLFSSNDPRAQVSNPPSSLFAQWTPNDVALLPPTGFEAVRQTTAVEL